MAAGGPSLRQRVISYQRHDSTTMMCGRIYDRLVARYGRKAVFMDEDSIPPGANFREYVESVIDQCAVELVVIVPGGLDIANATGMRRLDERETGKRERCLAAAHLLASLPPGDARRA